MAGDAQSLSDGDLLLRFATVVSPNFPMLSGTNIPVLDAFASATKATEEEQATAREAREIIEVICARPASDPARQLFARLYVPLQDYGRFGGGPGGIRVPERSEVLHWRLPLELVHNVIEKLDLLDFVKLDRATFASVRLVNRRVRNHTEETHSALFSEVVYAGLEDFLDRHGTCHDFALHLSPHSALLRARKLDIDIQSSHLPPLKHLLSLCANLHELTLRFAKDKVDISSISLEGCSNLQEITLDRVQGWEHVAMDFRQIRSLREVMVNGSWAVEVEAGQMSKTYTWPTWLRRLSLSNLGLTASEMETVAVLLAHGKLEILKLDNNGIGDEGVAALQLRGNTSLRELDLRSTNLTSAALQRLSLGANQSLRTLYLGANAISDVSLLQLDKNAALFELQLDNNPLASLDRLGLATNSTLKKLVLDDLPDGCPVLSAASFRRLRQQLANNTTLTHLSFDGCGIEDAVIGELNLGPNTGITTLFLQNNSITDVGLRAMQVDRWKGLEVVHLFGNSVTEELAAELSIEGRVISLPAEESTEW